MSLEHVLSSLEILAVLLLLLTLASILMVEKLVARLAEKELKRDKRGVKRHSG